MKDVAVASPRVAAMLVMCVCALLILTTLFFWIFAEFPRNSDAANTFLASADMAAGDWRLKGWRWASDPLWTSDLALEAGLIALFGLKPMIMALAAAIDWAGVVVLSVIATGAGKTRSHFAFLTVAVIVALPIVRNNPPMNLIVLASMHVGTILYILAMFLLAPVAATAGSRSLFALLALDLATALAVAGDPLALVVGAGAIILVMAIAAVKQRDGRKALVLLNVLGAASLGKGLVALNQATGGLHLEQTPMTFVSFDELPRNVFLTVKSFLRLTGSDFFGKDLATALLFLVRFPVLLAMGWALYAAGKRFIRYARGQQAAAAPDLLDQLLLVATAINMASGVTSSMLVNIDAARYFIPPVVFLAILAGRTLPFNKPVKAYGCVALGLSALALGTSYAAAKPKPALLYPDKQVLADTLVQHHQTDGYASYWTASVITAATAEAVRVRALAVCTNPVGCAGAFGKAVPALTLANQAWYARFGCRDRTVFVVADKGEVPQGLPESAVTATFGAPSQRYDLPTFVIDVFEAEAPADRPRCR